MPLITGCRLYVDRNSTAVAYSLEHARRLALPYIDKRQAREIEIGVASLPTQVWAYDYDIQSWVLQKSAIGFGKRSWRYSMLVKDGVIEKMFIEPEKDGDPFEVSDADTMLKSINPKAVAPEPKRYRGSKRFGKYAEFQKHNLAAAGSV